MEALRRVVPIIAAVILLTPERLRVELKTRRPQLPPTLQTPTLLPEPTVHFSASTPPPEPTPTAELSPRLRCPRFPTRAAGWSRTELLRGPARGTPAFWAYLPPGYGQNPDQRYPTLYLLHGLSADENQWKNLGLAATMDALITTEKIPPFIVILPRVPNISTYPSSYNARIFANNLIPYVDALPGLPRNNGYRAIGNSAELPGRCASACKMASSSAASDCTACP